MARPVYTPAKLKGSLEAGDIIEWCEKDEELRLAHDDKLQTSEKLSMWEYHPKGGVPVELVSLDPSTFLISQLGQFLCFLPRDILIRICSMLSVRDFVHLSLTCRFLHWRMFTFCTCYAPYMVRVIARDDRISNDFLGTDSILPKLIYTLNDGVIYDEVDLDGFGHNLNSDPTAVNWQYPVVLDGQRGLFVYQPFCLRRPFFFDTLSLYLILPFYYKRYYDRCLPYILAVKGLARQLDVTFINMYYAPKSYFNFLDTNEFLTTVKASHYKNHEHCYFAGEEIHGENDNKDIYLNCPYARQMHRVRIYKDQRGARLNVPIYENSIGIYGDPTDNAIKATLQSFLTGSTNLIYHEYVDIEKHNGKFLLIEYLFEKFGEFEEFFLTERCPSTPDENGNWFYLYYNDHVWKKVVETENGGLLRIVMRRADDAIDGQVTIGKEEMFDEMEEKYAAHPFYGEGNFWWKMETAVEPDELEELDTAMEIVTAVDTDLEPEVAEELTTAVEPTKVEELGTVVEPEVALELEELNEIEKSNETEESDDEEEQEPVGACLCLNNASCSIQ